MRSSVRGQPKRAGRPARRSIPSIMTSLSTLLLAETNQPLFGSQWLALFAVLGGIAGFVALIAVAGQWLARTHPTTPAQTDTHAGAHAPTPAAAASPVAAPAAAPARVDGLTPEVLAVIAAAVAATVGPRARIAAIVPTQPGTPSIEMLMQQWSVEGRRQIYSSHQIR